MSELAESSHHSTTSSLKTSQWLKSSDVKLTAIDDDVGICLIEDPSFALQSRFRFLPLFEKFHPLLKVRHDGFEIS